MTAVERALHLAREALPVHADECGCDSCEARAAIIEAQAAPTPTVADRVQEIAEIYGPTWRMSTLLASARRTLDTLEASLLDSTLSEAAATAAEAAGLVLALAQRLAGERS